MVQKIAYLQSIQVQCEHWRWSKKGMEEGSQASRQRCAEEETVAVHLSGVPSVSRLRRLRRLRQLERRRSLKEVKLTAAVRTVAP